MERTFSNKYESKTREELVGDLEESRAEIARLKNIIVGQQKILNDGMVLPAKWDEPEALNENREINVEELATRNEELLDAREALRKTEEEIRTIFELAGVAIFMADAGTGEIIGCNAKAEELIGRPREEIVGFHQTWLHPRKMAAESRDSFARNARRDSIANFETMVQHRDGRVIPVMINAARVTVNGRTVMLGLFLDITERKRAEEALQLTQFALDNFLDSAIWVTPDGGIAYVNRAACNTLGYSREELLSMHICDIDPNYTPEKFRELWPEKLQGRYTTFESNHVTRDGRVFPVEITSCYIRYGDKELLITFDRDISERKRIERELNLTHFSVDKAAEEVLWLESDGRVSYVNDATCRLLGYPRQEIQGMYVWDINPAFTPEWWLESFTDLKNKGFRNFETFHSTVDGRGFPVEITANYVEYDGMAYSFAFVRDITERKRAEREINEARTQAELYLDLMGHDIRNMNQVGMGYLELALDSPDIEKKDKELLLKSMGALDNSTRLIENVRKMQKARIGEYKLYELDACQVIQRVVGHYSNMPGEKAAINCEIPDSCMVMANDLLYEVFENLIVNAIKHAGPEPTINVGFETILLDEENHYRFTVEDNGPGIPDDSKERIFNRLHKGSARGMGLGLYIVRSLVDSYNGKVWAEDRVNGDHAKGARFVVLLPAVKG